jgi:hypothetical protein
VQTGDTLASIAQTIYGDSNYGYILAEANGLSVGAQPPVGMVLKIPEVTTTANAANTFQPYAQSQQTSANASACETTAQIVTASIESVLNQQSAFAQSVAQIEKEQSAIVVEEAVQAAQQAAEKVAGGAYRFEMPEIQQTLSAEASKDAAQATQAAQAAQQAYAQGNSAAGEQAAELAISDASSAEEAVQSLKAEDQPVHTDMLSDSGAVPDGMYGTDDDDNVDYDSGDVGAPPALSAAQFNQQLDNMVVGQSLLDQSALDNAALNALVSSASAGLVNEGQVAMNDAWTQTQSAIDGQIDNDIFGEDQNPQMADDGGANTPPSGSTSNDMLSNGAGSGALSASTMPTLSSVGPTGAGFSSYYPASNVDGTAYPGGFYVVNPYGEDSQGGGASNASSDPLLQNGAASFFEGNYSGPASQDNSAPSSSYTSPNTSSNARGLIAGAAYNDGSSNSLIPNGTIFGMDSNEVPYQNAWGGLSYQSLNSDGTLNSLLGSYGDKSTSTDPLLNSAINYLNGQQSGLGASLSNFASDLGSAWQTQQELNEANGTFVALDQLYGWGGQPNPAAWQQGNAGDCYFVTAGHEIALVNPSALTGDIFPHIGADGAWDGTYDVTFPGINANTVDVSGSGALQGPGNFSGIALNGNGSYAQVLEKGWAAVDGGWNGINAGNPGDAFFALTGDNSITGYNIFSNGEVWSESWSGVEALPAQNGNSSNPRYQSYVPNETQIQGGVDWSSIINISTDSGVVLGTAQDPTVDGYAWPIFPDSGGVVAQHAYTISAATYDPSTGGLQSVTLQNPYGPSGAVANPANPLVSINVPENPPPLTVSQLNQYISTISIYQPSH